MSFPKWSALFSPGEHRHPFHMPKHCPVCGGEIVREPGEAASRCINTNCPARLKESISHFASRGVMDIDGLGDVLVDQLVSAKLVASVADIYRLRPNSCSNLSAWAKNPPKRCSPISKLRRKNPWPGC